MKRIDQAEINYIFKSDSLNQYPYLQQHINAEEKVVKILARNPVAALAAVWHVGLAKVALSPFTMHYLLKSPLSVEEWTEKYVKHSKTIDYSYCYTTKLPVINNLICKSWSPPYYYKYRPLPNYNYFNRDFSTKLRKIRDDRFTALSFQLHIDTLHGLVDDEYMRNFGGHPITKDKWLRLKGVAGIYL